jgi:type II secretory ATPase GspE/PulE/Tfp pilus assembly ATPase PilB-like protein
MGTIVHVAALSSDFGTRCIVHIRHMAGLKLDGRRQPQDGRWTFRRMGSGRFADLRLNTIPTLCGETMALRLLSLRPELRRLDGLGFVGPQLHAAEDVLDSHGGMVLVVGPTGAGKTTAMYACLHRLNDGTRKIYTIEDPIEYAVPGLHQSQVDEVLGPSFEELLSTILRQSPDVIMVGEIRSAATAEIAVRAANAGNLVLATVHAPVAAQAIQSMLSLNVTPRFLATSLRAVIACRLIRKLDPANRIPVDLSGAPETFAEVQRWLHNGQGQVIYAPRESEEDPNSGYAGQTGVFEVMTVSPALKRMVEEMQTPRAITRQARTEGMLDFRQAAMLKVALGETSFEELARVIPGDDELSDGY